MFCTNCGASNKNGATLCENCGESLATNRIEDRLSRLRGWEDVSPSHPFDFLHPLFNFSFRRPVTVRMIRALHILSILCAALMALFFTLVGFETSLRLGLSALLIGAVGVLFTAVFSRVFLEMILVVFRMADQTAGKGVAGSGAAVVKEKAEPREGIQWNV